MKKKDINKLKEINLIELKNIFKKGNKNKLCYTNMSVPLFHYIELVISCVQKEEKAISRIKYTRYESHLYIYKFNTKDSTLQQSKKKRKEDLNPMTVCLTDHVKWIDK